MSEGNCGGLVMVVEDDGAVRASIAEVLADHDYRLVEAANGKEALERLRSGSTRPCVILLDMMMPVMDGWQFRALQRNDPELSSIPVVILTAHASPQEVEDVLGANAFLKKPVHLDDLLSIVGRLCKC